MEVIVLGSAAGGGFPQWNCNAPTSRAAREGVAGTKRRTQASIAVSADGEQWLLVNASPDLRQQLLQNKAFWPQHGLRDTPIKTVLLTSAEIDHVAGLLSMRESQPFRLWATESVLEVLAENPIFGALSPAYVERESFPLNEPVVIDGRRGSPYISVSAFPVPGKVPLFLESRHPGDLAGKAEDTIGLEIRCGEVCFHYVPGCAKLTPELRQRLQGSSLLFFDGTLWSDTELVDLGISPKTGARMGHMSISGSDGTLAAFADITIGRKIFIHVNTTNPVLNDTSPERATIAAAGWEVAEDGMRISL